MKKWIATVTLLLILISTNSSIVAAGPYDVPSSVLSGWSSNYGSNAYTMESGKRFAYDVYKDKYISGGYRITSRDFGKGSQQYLNFTGWAILFGHKRHTSTNNQTYIVARKIAGDKNIGSTKVYRADAFGGLSATEDLEYNNQGSGVWNECASTATNKNNLTCNMRYDNVSFSSYLPLKELFPDSYENAEWKLYIVKKVDSWMVWTPLKTPFSFSNRSWDKGNISFRSGGQANLLSTRDYPVLRRTYPRQLASSGISGKYFTVEKDYQLVDQDEAKTVLWFGLKTPEDGYATRWANSVYFASSGTQATIKYTATQPKPTPPSIPPKPSGICTAPVTPPPRYDYEFDFEAREIDGKTAQKNGTTQTNIIFYRKSFEANRNTVKTQINSDISSRRSLRTTQQSLLSQENTNYNNLVTQYNAAVASATNYDYSDAQVIVDKMKVSLQKIANYECSINTLNVEIGHYQNEYVILNDQEANLATISTSYTLDFGTHRIATKAVALGENQFSQKTIDWNIPSDGYVKANINSNRYSYGGVTEATYGNNIIDTPIYVVTNESVGMCSPLGGTSTVTGVVRTVNNSDTGSVSYNERVSTTLSIPSDHRIRRAGYGFDYTVSSVYTNDDPTSSATGTKTVKSYFPTLSSYLPYPYKAGLNYGGVTVGGYESNLQKLSASTFKLPTVYLEKFSGNVFDSMTTTHTKRNVADTLINGGTKYYIPFDYPNGKLTFNSVGIGAGVNNMTTCVSGEITVEGTPINDANGQDDFYQRPLSPEEPFPNGVGWNMQSNQTTINSLKTWYSEWVNDPFNPNASYNETFYLTGDVIAEIQQYAATNPLQKGKSLFNAVSIPRKK